MPKLAGGRTRYTIFKQDSKWMRPEFRIAGYTMFLPSLNYCKDEAKLTLVAYKVWDI